MISYNIKSKNYEVIDIPLEEVRFLHIENGKLYGAQNSIEGLKDNLFIMDLKTKKIEETNLNHCIREIDFSGNEITIASNDSVYVYDINNLVLKKSFEFDDDGLMFGTLIVK